MCTHTNTHVHTLYTLKYIGTLSLSLSLSGPSHTNYCETWLLETMLSNFFFAQNLAV